MNAKRLFALLFLLSFFLTKPLLATKKSDYYEAGARLREKGDWEEALRTWLAARDSLAQLNRSDPRIGFAFIELATAKKAASYYADASKLYFWGISHANLQDYKEDIERELDRLSAIHDPKGNVEWTRMLQNDDRALLNSMRMFWVKKDPIPTTEINERLLEHWQRIAYAREKFKNDSTSVYGTDVRGLVFVKYGKPDTVFSGKLGLDQLEIMRWIDSFLVRQEIQRYNSFPEYEIWVYFNLEPDRPTHFLFGKRSGFAKYGLKAGIEDFIPEHALRRNSAVNTGGIVPGFMLQLMYYRELMGVSQFFLNRFRDLESIWSNARASGSFSPSYNVLSGFLNHYRNLDSDKAKMKYLAVDKTNTLEGLMARDLFYRKYRYLENNSTPSLFIIATAKKQSNSEVKYVNYFRKARRSRFKDRYFLISYDQDWQEIGRLQDLPAMRSNKTSIFDVTQNDQARNFCLIAEEIVVNNRKVKIESSDMSDTVKVSAIGKRLLQELVPLSQDTTRFEVSDLLVGLSKTKRIDSTYQYPFPVIPVQPFKRTKALKVYLELYHLAADANNKTRFRINSEIKRIKKKGKAKGKQEKLVECFNFTADKKSLPKILSFDLSHLVPGDYCIRFEVQDLNALQSRARETRFTLVK